MQAENKGMKEQNSDPVTRVGLRTLTIFEGARAMAMFTGSVLLAAGAGVRRPRRLRPKEMLFHLQSAGADAMVLLAGLAFLMGFVIGIQAMATMSPFGAEARIARVVTTITMLEIGPLLTAILLAGRSGSAFAVQLGAMKTGGEIDGLRASGIDQVGDLVLPRVLALMAAGLLLVVITTAFSILGGMIITLWIPDLSFRAYLVGAADAMSGSGLFVGLAKIVVFSGLVGLIGCFQGLRMGESAASGEEASASFVVSLMNIVVIDALFSFIYHIN